MANEEPTVEIISTDEETLDVSDTENNLEPSATAKKYRGGRFKADVWSVFTENKNPQKLISATCKNCKTNVKYYSKSERVQKHLNICPDFRRLMKRTEPIDRPDWYQSNQANDYILSSNEKG